MRVAKAARIIDFKRITHLGHRPAVYAAWGQPYLHVVGDFQR